MKTFNLYIEDHSSRDPQQEKQGWQWVDARTLRQAIGSLPRGVRALYVRSESGHEHKLPEKVRAY